MGPESIAPSETPSQASVATTLTAPPTATPSLATFLFPPPKDYKKVDSNRTIKLLLIICFKLLCIIVCIISIALGVTSVTDSTAYKASMDDKGLCLKEICNDEFTISPACKLSFRRTKYLPDPGWISKFEAFKGLSIFAVVFGFLLLSIYGCWYAASGCNKAGWPLDLIFHFILGLIVGAGGILLLLSILDITNKGRRPFATNCETRFSDWADDYGPLEIKRNISSSTTSGGDMILLLENVPPTDQEIKEMTKYTGVMAAAVLAIFDALSFVTCAVLIYFLHPKEPPPQEESQVVVEVEQETKQEVVIIQEPPPLLPQPMIYQQQSQPSGPTYNYPQEQPASSTYY